MYFKPRIFISSTFDLIPIRKEVKLFLESVGAEVMLYEANLTPSTNPRVYKQDILEADFIIFLFDEKYGAKTDSGKSGTHEEWDIALNSDIPKHVYIKKVTGKRSGLLSKFLKREIQGEFISFYYYTGTKDLLSHIKSTVFTIARDISLNKIDGKYISKEKILALAIKQDFKEALSFIRNFEELKETSDRLGADFLHSTILYNFLLPYQRIKAKNADQFIDKNLNELYNDIFEDYEKFGSFQRKNFTTKGSVHEEIVLEKSGVEISYKDLVMHINVDVKMATKLLREFIRSYDSFKFEIFERKAHFEARYEL